jgi:hypothetical protein
VFNRNIYEFLPYAYVGAGSLVLLGMDTPMRWIPGLVLVCAGLLVLLLRITARSRARRVERIGREIRAMRMRHGLPESPRGALPARSGGRKVHPKRTARV